MIKNEQPETRQHLIISLQTRIKVCGVLSDPGGFRAENAVPAMLP
jgi:hypothetical protein